MSQPIKRYSFAVDDPWFGNGAYIQEDGKYVLYSDYAALAAENERLLKAGDAMMSSINYDDKMEWAGWRFSGEPHIRQCVKAWLAAKEGGDK